ncbi:hypothetical protein [Streptomyces sp. NPDC048606]|uniref:hypothetical protein n=1 Tax=Streptomyces sp. NPDC048606 TaxID=3154726 RepID=UPI0034316EC4
MSAVEETIRVRGPRRPAQARRDRRPADDRSRATDEGQGYWRARGKTNPAGSTNQFRGDVLRVLGVLKVATADQIQRIGAPHLTFRHADKETPSKRKQAHTASHTGALSDLRRHGLSENGGATETGDTLRTPHPQGSGSRCELRRPATDMGYTARGAGSSGASHPMADDRGPPLRSSSHSAYRGVA